MRPLRSKKKFFAVSAVLWAAVLLILAVQPDWVIGKILHEESLYPFAHVAAYAVFAYLLCFAIRFQRSLFGMRATLPMAMALAFVIAAIWGGINEWVQAGRTDRLADWKDFLVNLAGAAAGLAAFAARSLLHKRS